jgi:Na+/proline symporter
MPADLIPRLHRRSGLLQLERLDWIVIVGCVAAALIPGLLMARRAGRGTAEFFASGRSAPWWLVGTSMVATTFSTDTPNLVADLVRRNGVSGNWVWWALLLSGMMTVFFYAPMWRRSGALTDLEFYELRYSGKPGAFVRGFRAVYLGLIFNCCIMAAVTLAAVKIANVLLGWSQIQTIVVCGTISLGFSMCAGLWGVLVSDVVQFVIAMIGVFLAAAYALDHPQVGGLSGLVGQLDPQMLSVLPDFDKPATVLAVLIIPLTVHWWAMWYPGSEPGGGSYVAQRMLAARDESHALRATLWFNVAHYALRPWPWIIVALCSMVVYPELTDLATAMPHVDKELLGHDMAYPAMLALLPAGVLGLLVASLLSAYVSTMSTHLNWGASYLVNDLYRRFLVPGKSETHYVWVARGATAGLMVASSFVVGFLESARSAFTLLMTVGAGTGSIYLLRWFWWRVNAWSEITAMAVSFAVSLTIYVLNRSAGLDDAIAPEHALLWTVGITTLAWIGVTVCTSPADRSTLVQFYNKIRPAGPGWRRLRETEGLPPSDDSLGRATLAWVLGCVLIYAMLFGTGSVIYGQGVGAVIFGVAAALSGFGLWRVMR